MTAAVARLATDHDHRLVDGYARYCQNLIDAGMMSDRARRDRLRLARQFLDQHPDLDGWMARPLPARVRDLDRVKAWPLLTYAILTRRLVVDLDLLLVKDLGDFGHATERLNADDYRAGREIAVRLGWSRRWTYDVLHECLPLLLAWTGRSMRTLLGEDLDRFEAELHASLVVSVSSRRAYQARLFGLRQLLFEARIIDTPPTRRRTAASFADRLAAVAAPEIARVMLRYLEARSAVLRPSTVSSLCDALAVFGEYLAEQHPEVTSLRQLDRGHIEGFLAANATRRWRGRLARDQQVSPTVVHAAILDGPELPRRHHRLGLGRTTAPAADLRRRRSPAAAAAAPRSGAGRRRPADGRRRRAEGPVRPLRADPAPRRRPAARRTARPRTRQRRRLRPGRHLAEGAARQTRHRTVGAARPRHPRRPRRLGRPSAASNAPTRTPAPAELTDFLFSERGQRLGPWRIRSGLDQAVAAAGLTGADGQAPARRPAPTAAHLRHHPGQRRDEPASPDGPPRPRHRRDDPALRHPRLTHPARRLRRSDRQSPTPTARSSSTTGPVLPSKVDWLRGEMLKTRVAHGYCSRHLAADACPYANICEHCDNYMPAPEFAPALQDQLADVANPARRRRTTRLDQREQPTRTAHRTPPNPPRPHQLQLRHADAPA